MKKIETLAEYQQLASRTCPDLGSDEKNLLHMNLGIITEVGEFLDGIKKNIAYNKPLDLVNLGEELADMAWYIANKSRMFFHTSWEKQLQETDITVYQKEFEVFLYLLPKDDTLRIIILLNSVISPQTGDFEIDFVKEEFMGLKDIVMLQHIAEIYNIDFMQCLTNNIEKLQIRYPEKFTEEAALNRDLEAEREALEKTGSDDTAEN